VGNKGLDAQKEDKHESFGMVSINRISSSGTNLFGSIQKHHSFISLEIRHGSVSRHLANDWYHADSLPIVEIFLTHTQFAELITSPGQGSGVPCTIRAIEGKAMPECPAPETITSKFSEDLKATTKETVAELKTLSQNLAQALLPGEKGLNKTQLKELLGKIQSAVSSITDSIPFIESSFNEEMEKEIDKAKGEIEATIGHLIHNTGLKAIGAAAKEQMPEFPRLGEGKTGESK